MRVSLVYGRHVLFIEDAVPSTPRRSSMRRLFTAIIAGMAMLACTNSKEQQPPTETPESDEAREINKITTTLDADSPGSVIESPGEEWYPSYVNNTWNPALVRSLKFERVMGNTFITGTITARPLWCTKERGMPQNSRDITALIELDRSIDLKPVIRHGVEQHVYVSEISHSPEGNPFFVSTYRSDATFVSAKAPQNMYTYERYVTGFAPLPSDPACTVRVIFHETYKTWGSMSNAPELEEVEKPFFTVLDSLRVEPLQ
jgi:hypothetical protein